MRKGELPMNIVTWLSETIDRMSDGFGFTQLKPVHMSWGPTGSLRSKKVKKLFYGALIGASLASFMISLSAENVAAASVNSRKTVAAGLGYQDADMSSITVKTYDAESGEVLSSETYELDIKEDGPAANHPSSRIFAGGVGVGDDGLSEFTLRVYDAENGKFLWEGRLNLGIGIDPDVAAFPVVAHVQPRAAVVRVFSRTKTIGQPYFVLRAMNPQTGQVVWGDQFSADPANVKVERINRSVIGMTEVVPSEIDFRIKMPDEAGRQVLWEDKVVPGGDEEIAVPERSDDPGMLPVWPYGSSQTAGKDGI
jgi:hypothetical protein